MIINYIRLQMAFEVWNKISYILTLIALFLSSVIFMYILLKIPTQVSILILTSPHHYDFSVITIHWKL